MVWAKPTLQGITPYNQAGKKLIRPEVSDKEFLQAAQIVSEWRSAHAYPLHAITTALRQRVYRADPSGIVVQRRKRLISIINKLLKDYRLSQIQDIGGCRAVVSDLDTLNRLHSGHVRDYPIVESKATYMEGNPDNYILNPKIDGYRGIHYVFRYMASKREFSVFNTMKIEMQLRTQHQHSWATAVEIVDLFTGQNLKGDLDTNEADPDWKRFFVLMGSLIAMEERCPIVPNTSSNRKELVEELGHVSNLLKAVPFLEGCGKSVAHIMNAAESVKGSDYLIILDPIKRTLNIKSFDDQKILDEVHLETEAKYKDDPNIHVLQASAESLEEFKRAYPNYDLNTLGFTRLLALNLLT